LPAQFHGGDVSHTYHTVVGTLDHHVAEILHAPEIGCRRDRHQRITATQCAGRGLHIVGAQSGREIAGGDIPSRHFDGIDPQPHGVGLATVDVCRCHTRYRGDQRLHHAGNVVGDFLNAVLLTGELDILNRCHTISDLVDFRIRRSFGYAVPHLLHPGHDFGQRSIRIRVEHQLRQDFAMPKG